MTDMDGYPTVAELQVIEQWDPSDMDGLLSYIKENAWIYPDYISKKQDGWHVHTGGWSGHEEVIEAMEKNYVWWAFYWYSSKRGGHYIFKDRLAV